MDQDKLNIKSYDLRLKVPFTPPKENAELEVIQESIEELHTVFSNHPRKPLLDSLRMLGNTNRYTRVLGLVSEALKSAELIEITVEKGNL